MGVRTLSDLKENKSVLYDSVTDTAFGPVFYNSEGANEFLEWLLNHTTFDDPRSMSHNTLAHAYNQFCLERGDGN